MKVFAVIRTRNEESNIEKFCRSYDWADKILVGDGGSEDGTKELASQFPNVEVRDFAERIEMENGLWRNPHGRHLNFLIDWAESEGADYIIHDDVDSLPNTKLRQDARSLLTTNYIFVTRLYLWGSSNYFPKMSQGTKEPYLHSLWAWKVGTGLRFKEEDPLKQEFTTNPHPSELRNLEPPDYCLLHNFCPTPEVAEKKVKFYRESGQQPDALHPLYFGGNIEPLPDWAK